MDEPNEVVNPETPVAETPAVAETPETPTATEATPTTSEAESYVVSKGYTLEEAKNIVRQYGEAYVLKQKTSEEYSLKVENQQLGVGAASVEATPPGQRQVKVYDAASGKRFELDRMIDTGATLDIWVKS